MDKYLYLAMNGAAQAMLAQQNNANNLANVSTVGFKANLDHFQSQPVTGPGYDDRVYVTDKGAGANFKPGAITTTGRDLDIAIPKFAKDVFRCVRYALEARQAKKSAGALDCVDQAENVGQKLRVIRILLKFDKFHVENTKALVRLGQKFTKELVHLSRPFFAISIIASAGRNRSGAPREIGPQCRRSALKSCEWRS